MGKVSFRVQKFRPATTEGFRKGTFELEVLVDGTPIFGIADCALLESNGELYVAGPSRPMIQRIPDSDKYTILQDDKGKGRYFQILTFPREAPAAEGVAGKFTEAAFATKNEINELAIAAFRGARGEAAGRGAVRSGAKAAPANAKRTVDAEPVGLPGDLDLEDSDLPF